MPGAEAALPLLWSKSWSIVLSRLSRPELLQAAVLVLQLFHLPDLVRFRADILLLPAVERLFADPRLCDHVRDKHSHFCPLQNTTICATEQRSFFISQSSAFAGSVLAEDSRVAKL